MDMILYLKKMIEQFEHDPADNDYQRGYLAAIEELLRVVEEDQERQVNA